MAGNVILQDSTTARTTSTVIGGFVQDSWQILDKVTLNAGLRYDTQTMFGADGTVGLSLPNQWSPRVGVIYDFSQQGRSKVYAYYARFYETVPLNIADRAFPGEVQVGASHNTASCDPSVNPNSEGCRGSTGLTRGDAAYGNGVSNPNQFYNRTGGDKVPVDPDIKAQSSDQIVIGGEYEVFPDARLALNYTHSYLNQAIEDMSRDEANTYFLGNPALASRRTSPRRSATTTR